MRKRTVSAVVALATLGTAAGFVSTAKAAPASHAAALAGGLSYSGGAYGTFAEVGHTVVAGKTSVATLGCTMNAGLDVTNSTAAVSAPPLITTGAINSEVQSLATTDSVATTSSNEVNSINLLGGLITGAEVKSVSTTSHDATGFHVSPSGSTLLNLVVGGALVAGVPAPNTTINVLGLATVVLNEQKTFIGAHNANFTVNMIHVTVTNIPGIAAGTEIIVAHAESGLTIASGVLDGSAYGSRVNLVGQLVSSGRTALIGMPCGGTGGRVRTNTAAGVSVPGVINSGTVTDTVQGTVAPGTEMGETTATTQDLSALGGLITGDVIKADAHATMTGGVVTLSDAGSTVLNLKVGGTTIAADVAANTKIKIGSITIWLHRVVTTTNSIEVRMIEVQVHGPNPFNLLPGSDIRVAVAEASVH